MQPTLKFLGAIIALSAPLILLHPLARAADPFEGTWKVSDTAGKPFEIVLAAGGAATANREGEGMTGTWKSDGSAAVITWNTGWTTKIAKSGEKYMKSAFKKGASTDGEPANTSPAEKVK